VETLAAVMGTLRGFAVTRRGKEANEARTRVELIDNVLNAMGWPVEEVEREASTGGGGFLDYELWATDVPFMVLEAKRVGRVFDLQAIGRGSRVRSLNTLLSRGGEALREVLKQASTYCNDRGIPLACVSNGLQWVFFRGLS